MKLFISIFLTLICLSSVAQEAELNKAVSEGLVLDHYYQARFKKLQNQDDIDKWLKDNDYVLLKYQYGTKSKFGGVQKGIVGVAFISEDVAIKEKERQEKAIVKAKLASELTLNNQKEIDTFNDTYGNPNRVEGKLILRGNITNLKGLSKLSHIDKLTIEGTKLRDLKGLNFQSTGWIEISNNDQLESLSGIENLNRAEYFGIRDNPKLTNISALSRDLLVEQTFSLTGNHALSTCSNVFYIAASRYNISGNKEGCGYAFEIKPKDYPIAVRPAFYKLQLGNKVYAIQFISDELICYKTYPDDDFAMSNMYVHFNKHNEWEVHKDKSYAKYYIVDGKVKISTHSNEYFFTINSTDQSLANNTSKSKPFFNSKLDGCVYGNCQNGYGILMSKCYKRGKGSYLIEGNFKNGLTTGYSKYYAWDYTFWSHEGMFKEGKRHGRGIERHDAYLIGTTRGEWIEGVYQKPERASSYSTYSDNDQNTNTVACAKYERTKTKTICGSDVKVQWYRCGNDGKIEELYYWTKSLEDRCSGVLYIGSFEGDGFYKLVNWDRDVYLGNDKEKALKKLCGCN